MKAKGEQVYLDEKWEKIGEWHYYNDDGVLIKNGNE
ncbi:MAG: hypothetical protein ACJA0U_001335 [Salibacteraceae bacterium]